MTGLALINRVVADKEATIVMARNVKTTTDFDKDFIMYIVCLQIERGGAMVVTKEIKQGKGVFFIFFPVVQQ